MSNFSCGISILAAGMGTRLKLDTPKALAPILGKKLIDFPLANSIKFISQFDESLIGVVTGHRFEEVEGYVTENYCKGQSPSLKLSYARQLKQLGTADALKIYFDQTKNANKMAYTVIICADTPLIRDTDLNKLLKELKDNPKLDGVAATFIEKNPQGYGRIQRSNSEIGFTIVEEKDANEAQKKITEVNSGLYIFKTDFALKHLSNVSNKNKSGEFYLTDLFQNNYMVKAILFEKPETFIGVNTLKQLEQVSALAKEEKLDALRANGVRMLDANSIYIDWDITVGAGTVLYPGIFLKGKSKVGENSVIENGSVIKDSVIENNVTIKAYSYLEETIVHNDCQIGPFARLRPGTDVGEESKIGNFVETKKAKLDKGVKISHLSYVGDAFIGEESNIGCGFVTCNYDGIKKHVTKIGKRTFIGSDCQAVAPVTIGDDCFVAAGSTITNSMNDGDFAIARSRQVTKEGTAKKFLKPSKK
ncbi:MAG: bifunctional UDP-N-acetylglucosamine diphosphorylase/glucosamine-1-phosphate N-acetyltransferase GlmU [Bacteriovoracaceae bacterium]